MRKYVTILLLSICAPGLAQKNIVFKDSVVKRIVYRDTIVYRKIYQHDTVRVRHFVFSDTINTQPTTIAPTAGTGRKRRMINTNSWGIGPSIGTYYSPINGFDINIGFGVQYYLLAIPSFRNPHMGHRRKK